jgi:uncharacterized protein
MDDIAHISLLLDYYGKLLTGRQQEMLDLYCNYDNSLCEIAQQFNITRQGVYDAIHTAKAQLEEYDDKLKLLEYSNLKRKSCDKAVEKIKGIINCKPGISIGSELKDLIPMIEKIKNIGDE